MADTVQMHRRWLAFALIAATLVVYAPTLGHEFVRFDDYEYVVGHPQVLAGLDAATVRDAFLEPYWDQWTPLTVLSLALDFELFGMDPRAFHATSALLHALAAGLLFAFLARASGAPGASAFVAAVFAFHPLHVESVAWAAERKDVLCGLFWMASLWAWARYAERPGVARYALVVGAVGAALLAKPMAVTLPLVLLLVDAWPLRRLDARSWRRCALEKLPLLALAGGVAWITWSVQQSAGSVDRIELDAGLRLANAVRAYGVYLVQSFWPVGLAVLYPHPGPAISMGQVWLSASALVLLTAVALGVRRSRPWATVGWLWFGITLVPVIGLIQVGVQAHADRYMYLPLVGLSIPVAWGAAQALGDRPVLLRAAGLGCVAAMIAVTSLQLRHWRDPEALARRALAVTERNAVMHTQLSAVLLLQRRAEEAEHHAREALRIDPDRSTAYLNLAAALGARGDLDGMVRALRTGLALGDDLEGTAGAHFDLGIALLLLERPGEARPALERALRDGYAPSRAHAALGFAAEDPETAAYHYREALRLEPGLRFAAAHLARLEARPSESFDEEGYSLEALRVSP